MLVSTLVGSELDKFSCNAALRLCTKGGWWKLSVELLRLMGVSKIQVDVIAASTALAACARSSLAWLAQLAWTGQWRVASTILAGMEHGLKPDTTCYNTGINGCTRCLQWRLVLARMWQMRRAGMEATAVSRSEVLEVLCQSGLWQRAWHFLQRTTLADAVMQSIAIGLSQWRIGLLASDAHLKMDTVSLNASLRTCSEGSWRSAALRARGLQPDVATGSATASGCEWHRALDASRQMRRWAVQATARLQGTLVSSCQALAQWVSALRLLADFLPRGLQLTRAATNSAMSACGPNWLRALALFAAVPPDAIAAGVRIAASEWMPALNSLRWAGLRYRRSTLLWAPVNRRRAGSSSLASCGICHASFKWILLRRAQPSVRQAKLAAGILQPPYFKACGGRCCDLMLGGDVAELSAAIAACERARKWANSIALLRVADLQLVHPNTATFGAAISACEQAQRQTARALAGNRPLLCNASRSTGGATARATCD
ncbi:unnamed protein product [Effrenium voratum]|nr:unnamed protein product [Effrenium voratum]